MDFLGICKMFLFIIVPILFNSWCYCQSVYFKLEHEDTSIVKTNEVQPFLNESVASEMECYMKCLGDQHNCCLIEMKEKAGKVSQCLLYSISPVYLRKVYEKNSRITSVVDKDCKLRKSCLEWYQKGEKKDGVYKIHVNGKSVNVFCDMTTDGGGWTVLQRRFDGSVSFAQTWDEYKNGFGDANGEYWLGNNLIHQLTNIAGGTLIRFKATSIENESKYIIFNGFKINDENDKYKMLLGDDLEGDVYLLSQAKNTFVYNNGSYFSTLDQDNDVWEFNCASRSGGGGFWYKGCSLILPNSRFADDGIYHSQENIRWRDWNAGVAVTYIKFFQISIR